jgi:DNA mismatch endonuclease (patch repair protein)
MRAIRSRDTKPEMQVRCFLHAAGFRYRLHVRELPGNPDIVLPKYRAAIFVQGCFWHQHSGCANGKAPTSNAAYWGPKLKRTIERDRLAVAALEAQGWRVFIVWECALSLYCLRTLEKSLRKK